MTNRLVPASAFRNCRITEASFGELFIADDGDKFVIGRAGDGKLVALILAGTFSPKQPQFYFAPLDSWNRRGVAVVPKISVDPSSLADPNAIPPGSISLDDGTVHILGFSGRSHQPVAISGEAEHPSTNAVAFTKWAMIVEGANGEPVELYAQAPVEA